MQQQNDAPQQLSARLISLLKGGKQYTNLIPAQVENRFLRCGHVRLLPGESVGRPHFTQKKEEVIVPLAWRLYLCML